MPKTKSLRCQVLFKAWLGQTACLVGLTVAHLKNDSMLAEYGGL
jgi:hypothetical protein